MDLASLEKRFPSRMWPRVATFISILGTLALGFHSVHTNYGQWMVVLAIGAVLVALNIWYHRHKSLDLNRVLDAVEGILGR